MIDDNSTKEEIFIGATKNIGLLNTLSEPIKEQMHDVVIAYLVLSAKIESLDGKVKEKANAIINHTRSLFLADQIDAHNAFKVLSLTNAVLNQKMSIAKYQVEAGRFNLAPTPAMKFIGGLMMSLSTILFLCVLVLVPAANLPVSSMALMVGCNFLCSLFICATGHGLYNKGLPLGREHNQLTEDIDNLADAMFESTHATP
jgi:hypothetical protein